MKNLFLLGALLIPTIVYSANDLERWNSEVGRTVRQTHSDKLAQTTYSEISSKNVKVSQNMKTVYPQIETNAQVAGSRTRVVAEATLVVDKDKVWKDWARKIGKFGKGANAVGGALVVGGLIVDAAGWVIDEGGNVTKQADTSYKDPSNEFYYNTSYTYNGGGSCSNPESYFKSTFSAAQSYAMSCASGDDRYKDVKPTSSGFSVVDKGTLQVEKNPILKINNPYYNPSAPPPERIVVSEKEKEQVLKNLLNDPKYADLAAQMIGNTYSMGPDNPEPDPNVVNDLKNKQKDVLKSDNPKGDGKTRTDPKIDTGTQGQADTTPKPDTGTGTGTTPSPNPSSNTGSTTNFELPAFCNYAAKLCDWLDWTQEDKELQKPEKEEPEELDLGTIDKNRFRANGQCPAPIEVNESVTALGKSVDFDLTIEWTQICNVAEDTSPLVLLISTITGLLILVGGGRSSEP